MTSPKFLQLVACRSSLKDQAWAHALVIAIPHLAAGMNSLASLRSILSSLPPRNEFPGYDENLLKSPRGFGGALLPQPEHNPDSHPIPRRGFRPVQNIAQDFNPGRRLHHPHHNKRDRQILTVPSLVLIIHVIRGSTILFPVIPHLTLAAPPPRDRVPILPDGTAGCRRSRPRPLPSRGRITARRRNRSPSMKCSHGRTRNRSRRNYQGRRHW